MTTNKELATTGAPNKSPWNDEDIKLIKDTVANGATDSEFKLFLYTAAKYDLDPLVKQIWCIKYGSQPAAIYTSAAGFLTIAHRSGQFDGMITFPLRNAKGELVGAGCKVWRKDMTHPFEVEVPLSEYNTGKSNWLKMPETMIKKVAESQCLRKAFDISGLYEPSEYTPPGEATEITNTATGEITTSPERGKYLPVSTKSYEEFKWEFEQAQTLEALDNVSGRVLRSGLIANQLEMLRVHRAQAKKRIKAALEPPQEPEEGQDFDTAQLAAVEIFGGNPK